MFSLAFYTFDEYFEIKLKITHIIPKRSMQWHLISLFCAIPKCDRKNIKVEKRVSNFGATNKYHLFLKNKM